MSFLLDTNICSAHMRRAGGLAHRFMQHTGRLAVPTIVLAELYAGAYRHPNSTRLLGLIAGLLQEVGVLDFDAACAEQFGRLRGSLSPQGLTVSTADLMIASVALVHDLTLVTNNTADFQWCREGELTTPVGGEALGKVRNMSSGITHSRLVIFAGPFPARGIELGTAIGPV